MHSALCCSQARGAGVAGQSRERARRRARPRVPELVGRRRATHLSSTQTCSFFLAFSSYSRLPAIQIFALVI